MTKKDTTEELDVQTTLQSVMDTMRTLATSLSKLSIESEITDPGHDEAWKLNMKRMYDEYQHESLEAIRRSRLMADQILQNSIETANLTSKQAVRHAEIAIDRQWNVDEQGYTARAILSDEVFKEGIKEAVIEAVKAIKK